MRWTPVVLATLAGLQAAHAHDEDEVPHPNMVLPRLRDVDELRQRRNAFEPWNPPTVANKPRADRVKLSPRQTSSIPLGDNSQCGGTYGRCADGYCCSASGYVATESPVNGSCLTVQLDGVVRLRITARPPIARSTMVPHAMVMRSLTARILRTMQDQRMATFPMVVLASTPASTRVMSPSHMMTVLTSTPLLCWMPSRLTVPSLLGSSRATISARA